MASAVEGWFFERVNLLSFLVLALATLVKVAQDAGDYPRKHKGNKHVQDDVGKHHGCITRLLATKYGTKHAPCKYTDDHDQRCCNANPVAIGIGNVLTI